MLFNKIKLLKKKYLERSIKQRANQILNGVKINKKIKHLNIGDKLDYETINSLNISDVFKLTVGETKKKKLLFN